MCIQYMHLKCSKKKEKSFWFHWFSFEVNPPLLPGSSINVSINVMSWPSKRFKEHKSNIAIIGNILSINSCLKIKSCHHHQLWISNVIIYVPIRGSLSLYGRFLSSIACKPISATLGQSGPCWVILVHLVHSGLLYYRQLTAKVWGV